LLGNWCLCLPFSPGRPFPHSNYGRASSNRCLPLSLFFLGVACSSFPHPLFGASHSVMMPTFLLIPDLSTLHQLFQLDDLPVLIPRVRPSNGSNDMAREQMFCYLFHFELPPFGPLKTPRFFLKPFFCPQQFVRQISPNQFSFFDQFTFEYLFLFHSLFFPQRHVGARKY